MYNTDQWIKEYDPKGKFRQIVQDANCCLVYNEEISAEAMAQGSDSYKQHIKKNMAYVMGEAMLPKISYTVTDNPHTQTKRIRAKVFVFTEAEILKLVEDILNAA